MMAAIWEDMRDHYEEGLVSHEVIDSLRERQARVVPVRPSSLIGIK